MYNTKKRWLTALFLTTLFLTGALSACNNDQNNETTAETSTETGAETTTETEPETAPETEFETPTETIATTGDATESETDRIPESETETETTVETATETETETAADVITDVMIGETLDAPYAESFTVSNVFSNDMVVQRGEHIRVWGYADESENGHKISGEFKGMFAEALIENGEWTLTFGARLEASAEPGHTMRIYTDKTEYTFRDVLVGDVFMVIGQSNTAYSVANHRSYIKDAERGGAGYDDTSLPIRLHYNSLTQSIGLKRGTADVCTELQNGSTWQLANSASINRFSALGYLFAVEYTKETGVPVGMIEIDGNGQPIGAFMSNEAAEAAGSDTWSEAKGYYTTQGCNGDAARYMYNHYMYPFEKYALAGVIWYQGESDLQSGMAESFPEKLATLMTYMRSTHNLVDRDFPVYLIEFPTIYQKSSASVIPSGYSWQFMDVGLVRATLGSTIHRIPNCYLVSSADLWSDNTFWNNLHPNCKFEQAQRAAHLAASIREDALVETASGPILSSVDVSEDGKMVVLTYTHVGSGLVTSDGGTSVTGFVGLVLDRQGNVRKYKTPLSAEITAPDQVTLTFGSSVKGIAYHVVTDVFFGQGINLMAGAGIPAGADFWIFE